jgi:hypothetical protein
VYHVRRDARGLAIVGAGREPCYRRGVKRALAVVLLAACGGHQRTSSPAPAAQVRPDVATELRLRREAAIALGCETAATTATLETWDVHDGTYVVRGCGFEVRYLVACDAPDRCGFTPSE